MALDRSQSRTLIPVAVFLLFTASLDASDAPPSRENDVERELRSLRRRISKLEEELQKSKQAEKKPEKPEKTEKPEKGREPENAERPMTRQASEEAAAREAAEREFSITPVWGREPLETPESLRGVYEKPFLASLWQRAFVGGYTEFEYHSFEDPLIGIPEGFRMHRTNLFLFSEISDTVRFGSELEFETEFGIEPGVGARPSDDIEVAVEMAFVDWTIFKEFQIRGGALLAPLGRINVNHDGPARELTERPLVSTFVIPTTLTEAGIGVHGTFSLPASLSLSYEAYAVNGFDALDEDGTLAADPIEREKLLREARSSSGGDINNGVASTGRIALRGLNAFDVGGSWHVGTYDEEGDNFLTIIAGDAAVVHSAGPMELALEGEIAVANFERDNFARGAGVPDRFWGYYTQMAARTMPKILQESIPHVFGPDSNFAFVLRYEWVNLDGDRGEVVEPGFNFRPVSDTVFKFSYRITQKAIGVRDVPGRDDFDDDGFVFSLSSYF